MYWVQTAYNLNNVVQTKELIQQCHANGIEQIIVGDEGPYAWVELEDHNRATGQKVQVIYATHKKEGDIEVVWLFKGDVLKAAALLEKMYREKKFYFSKDLIPLYVPSASATEQTHKKTIQWLGKISPEFYVMKNQENKELVENYPFLNAHSTYVHRVRCLEIDDVEITDIRRKINGEKIISTDYHQFLKPEHFLRGEGIEETKKKFKKIIGFLKITSPESEITRKMEFWDHQKVNAVKLTNKWERFFSGDVKLPENPKERRKIQLLCTIAGKGFNKRYKKNDTDALEQLKKELAVVVNLGFYEYFLMVQDFTDYAHKNGIMIGQRGSVIGSVLAYCLGITDVDPIEYGLKFERFLTKDRADKPDIDIDVQASRLKDMLNYIREKYGEENVAKIITFSSFGFRIAINNVRKIANVKEKLEDSLPKIKIPLEEFLQTEAYDNFLSKMTMLGHREIIEQALKLAEQPKNYSVHTAGIVISEEINQVPIVMKEGERIIPFSKNAKQIERMGFIKFDFLSAPILDVIMETKKMVGHDFEIPLTDEEAFSIIGSESSYGIFQIKSLGIKEIAKKIQPKNLNDVMDVLALSRPGPKDELQAYLKNREQKNYLLTDLSGNRMEKTTVLESVLKRTNGILIYQEQIMEASEVWAGLTKEESDNFRVAVSSKNKEKMEKQRKEFLKKSKLLGRDVDTTEKIFEIIKKFAEYGFNKSHAAGYAIRTFETAYLKKHHTKEFMIALANAALEKGEDITEIMREMVRLGLKIEKPKLAKATTAFKQEEGAILFPVAAIKEVGMADVRNIEEAHFNEIKTVKEFVEAKQVNLRVKEVLVKVGVMDHLGDRWQILMQLRKDKKEYHENKNAEQRKVIYKKWEKELIRM